MSRTNSYTASPVRFGFAYQIAYLASPLFAHKTILPRQLQPFSGLQIWVTGVSKIGQYGKATPFYYGVEAEDRKSHAI
jgi:hypothetical protein